MTVDRLRSDIVLCGLVVSALALFDLSLLAWVGPNVIDDLGAWLVVGVVVPGTLGGLLGLLKAWIHRGERKPIPAWFKAIWVFLLVVPPIASALRSGPGAIADSGRPRILLIGVDGATWTRIDPLIAAGDMPHMAKLVAEGTRGILRSELPAFSPIVWTTIASGKPPSVHGVTGAAQTSRSVAVQRVWDIMENVGLTTGTFGYLITWPPRTDEDGFCVPGWTARGPESNPESYGFINRVRFAFAENGGLSRSAAAREGFRAVCDWAKSGGRLSTVARGLGRYVRGNAIPPTDLDRFYLNREILLDAKIDAFAHLMARHSPDFTAIYLDTVDNQSHIFWKFFEPEHFEDVSAEDAARYGQVIPDSYRHMDEAIGRILEVAGPRDLVMVVSDHGFEAGNRNQRTFQVGPLLEVIGMPPDAVTSYVTIHPRLYLTPKDPETGAELTRRILACTESNSGDTPFVAQVLESGEVEIGVRRFHGALDGQLGDLIYDGVEHDYRRVLDTESRQFSGAHNLDGIFLAVGSGVQRGATVTGANLYDVAPTLLAAAELPIADDMPGRPLLEIFTDAHRNAHPVRNVPTYESGDADDGTTEEEEMPEALRQHLRSLGYIN